MHVLRVQRDDYQKWQAEIMEKAMAEVNRMELVSELVHPMIFLCKFKAFISCFAVLSPSCRIISFLFPLQAGEVYQAPDKKEISLDEQLFKEREATRN
jgi:hypothetical protein